MPKMKTHKGAKKRFKTTGTGKIMRRKANKSHILEKKTAKRKRQLGKEATVDAADKKTIERQLGRR